MFKFDSRITFPDKSIDLLAVGELLIDMISQDFESNTRTSNTYHRFFGGSPANIAMNVRQFGLVSRVVAAVGKDAFGAFLLSRLHDAGIDVSLVQEVDYSTSLVAVARSRSSPIPIFYRNADYHLSYTPKIEAIVSCSKILHFSSWPISMSPARGTVERMIEKAKEHQMIIGFDPNYHPMIWKQGEEGVEYIKSILPKVDIVKPSEDDAERLFGKDTPKKQVEKFLRFGAKLVIMTLGEHGALVSNGSEVTQFDTLATEVADTTGAGDAFWSGFYTAVVKGHTIREALTFGFAVSAFKLQFTGAVVDFPSIDVIKRMYHV